MFWRKIKNLKKEILNLVEEKKTLVDDNEVLYNENELLSNELKSIKEEKENLEYENSKKSHLLETTKEINSTLSNLLLNSLEENYDTYYNSLKKYDEDGFVYLSKVQQLTGISSSSFYGNFYYEDNIGAFEDMDGYTMAKYYEKMQFADIIDSTFIGSYEKCEYSTDYVNTDEYKEFIKNVKINTVKELLSDNSKLKNVCFY